MTDIRVKEAIKLPFHGEHTDYGMLNIPADTRLMCQTSPDNNEYHFINEFEWLDRDPERIAQAKAAGISIEAFNEPLKNDLRTHGLNVPAEYCVDTMEMTKILNLILWQTEAEKEERFIDTTLVAHWQGSDEPELILAELDKELGVVSDFGGIARDYANEDGFLGFGVNLDVRGLCSPYDTKLSDTHLRQEDDLLLEMADLLSPLIAFEKHFGIQGGHIDDVVDRFNKKAASESESHECDYPFCAGM